MRSPVRLPHLANKLGRSFAVSLFLVGLISAVGSSRPFLSLGTAALASPEGDTCRKEICEGAVAACLRADLSLNPFARTEGEKRNYCGQYYSGCMQRTISADVNWYSPSTLARFLECPS
jgi:hypothetical protein